MKIKKLGALLVSAALCAGMAAMPTPSRIPTMSRWASPIRRAVCSQAWYATPRCREIPTVDVIAYYPDCQQSSFGPTWHTVSDDMAHLDKNVLKAVGQTMIQVLYTEE